MEQVVRTADPEALQKGLSDGQRQISSLQSLKNPQVNHSRGRMVMPSHYKPVQEYECKKIQRALDILKGVIYRENKRHQMDEYS